MKSLLKLKPPALLDALLDCWRSTRDGELTPLIIALSEQGEASFSSERPAKLKQRVEWLNDAFDDGHTFAGALHEARIFAEMLAASQTLVHFGPVVSHWLALEPDPRLASLALWLLQEYPDATTHGARYARPCVMPNTITKTLVKVLFMHCDSSHAIEAFIAQRTREVDEETGPLDPYPSTLERELKRARKANPQVAAFSESDLAALRKHIGPSKQPAAAKPAKSSVSESSLLEAICAAPDDDGPRAVYADWLLEQGRSSLGEFIQLQLEAAREKLSTTEKTREKALLKEIRPEVLKQFGGNTYAIHLPSARFARGFVVEATLRCDANVPALRLVERVTFDDPIVEGARFDRLTLARTVPVASAATLLKAAPRLENLQVAYEISSYRKKPAAPVLEFFKKATHQVKALACAGDVDEPDQLIAAVLASSLAKNARFLSLGVLPNPLTKAQLAKVPPAVQVLQFGRLVGSSQVAWALGRDSKQRFTQLAALFGRFVTEVTDAQPLLEAQLPAFGELSTISWSFGSRNGTELHHELASGLKTQPTLEAKQPTWAEANHPLSLFDFDR